MCLQVAVVAVAVPGCATQGDRPVGVTRLVGAIVREGLSDCHLAVVGYGQTVIKSILR